MGWCFFFPSSSSSSFDFDVIFPVQFPVCDAFSVRDCDDLEVGAKSGMEGISSPKIWYKNHPLRWDEVLD